MNWRAVTIISLAANVVLAAFLVVRGLPTPPPTIAPAPDAAATTPTDRFPTNRVLRAEPTVLPPAGNLWRQIESTDYRTYIANLRSVGCPEHVIRDVVAEDIHEVYEGLRGQPGPPLEPWASGAERAAQMRQERDRRRALDAEERAVLKELLGVEWSTEVTENWHDDPEVVALLGFVSPEKGKRFMGIVERYGELGDQLRDATEGVVLPSDQEAMQRLKDQFASELSGSLTPAEWGEMRLRLQAIFASFGSDLHLDALDVEPNRLRELLAAHMQHFDPFDELFFQLGQSDDAAAQKQRKADFEQEARRILGDDDFAELKRAEDYLYREALEFTRENDLPRTTAIELQQFKNSIQVRRNQVLNDPALSREAQQAALAELKRVAMQDVGRSLGSAAAAYQEKQLAWFNSLEQLPPPGSDNE